MAKESARRAELAEAATDYALAHGLIDLSLRPLAAELGTSDRMLLYHFDSKDDLVATVLRTSSDRSVAEIRALSPSRDVRTGVVDLWHAATAERMDRCQRMYVEAAALGLLGREPYASVVNEANERWVVAMVDHLVASGADRRGARRAVALVDATFMGLQLDLPLAPDAPEIRRVVRDVADAAAVLCGQGRA